MIHASDEISRIARGVEEVGLKPAKEFDGDLHVDLRAMLSSRAKNFGSPFLLLLRRLLPAEQSKGTVVRPAEHIRADGCGHVEDVLKAIEPLRALRGLVADRI